MPSLPGSYVNIRGGSNIFIVLVDGPLILPPDFGGLLFDLALSSLWPAVGGLLLPLLGYLGGT